MNEFLKKEPWRISKEIEGGSNRCSKLQKWEFSGSSAAVCF